MKKVPANPTVHGKIADGLQKGACIWMTVRMFLKSRVTPPGNHPMASIFCDWRSYACNFGRLLISRKVQILP
jgi:hypothetical protein